MRHSAPTHHPIPWWDHQLHYLVVHGLNLVIGLGAGAGAVAVGAGFVGTAMYGRRASVSLSAEVHQTPAGVVVAVRPVVKAVGILRVKFKESDGVIVHLRDLTANDGDLVVGEPWDYRGAFGKQYVDAGEELSTTVVYPPMQPSREVVGWLVSLSAAAPVRFVNFRTAAWGDQVFVPRPTDEG